MFGKAPITALTGALLFGLVGGAPGTAEAVTVTGSYTYIGDICDDFDADGGASGTDFNDCDEIVQSNGSPVGTFGMNISGLNPRISSDATFSLSVRVADLFGVGGGNNPRESFGFRLEDYRLGNLFDETTADEAAINAGLAASVQSSIDASTASSGAVNLIWTMAAADLYPIVQDGTIGGYFDFTGDVNSMRDIDFSVTYAAVPVPASGALIVAGLGLLGFMRRKTDA